MEIKSLAQAGQMFIRRNALAIAMFVLPVIALAQAPGLPKEITPPVKVGAPIAATADRAPPVAEIPTVSKQLADEHAIYEQRSANASVWLVIITGVLTIATCTLALYTWRLWNATSQLVESASDTARRQLRAYIDTHLVPSKGMNPTTIVIRAANSGQTPARNVRGRLNTFPILFGSGIPPQFDFPMLGKADGPTTIRSMGAGTEGDWTFPIDNSYLVNVHDRKAGLLIYGHLDYEDIFGRSWTSRFCYQYVGERRDGAIHHAVLQSDQYNDAT